MTNIKLDFEQRQQAERMAENGDQLDQCFELVWSRAEIERLNQNIERRQAEKEKLQGIMVQMVETGQVTQVEPPVQRGVPLRFEFAEHCGCCVRNKITLDVFGARAAPREASKILTEYCPKCSAQMSNWSGKLTKCVKCLHEWYMDSTAAKSTALRVCPKCDRNWISGEEACDCDPTPEHLLRQGYRSGKVSDRSGARQSDAEGPGPCGLGGCVYERGHTGRHS